MQDQNVKLKQLQKEFLRAFSKKARNFALTGGTALELYYLRHRFSVDLDFFSPKYNIKEIEEITAEFKKIDKCKIKLDTEFILANAAKVRFYYAEKAGLDRPLKIDFVEDIVFDKPDIEIFDGVRVYSAQSIYLQKITTIIGLRQQEDAVGRQITQGRREARDAFDIYMLSKKIKPLHEFLKGLPALMQRGMAHWHQTFSRQDLKLGLLDMDIYDKKFDSREMIIYLDNEMKLFIKEVLAE